MEEDEFFAYERGVLEAYFSALGRFNFDKAKEIVEKERDVTVKSLHLFSCVLTALSQLAVAEKLYMSLQYVVPKSFLRKDTSLRSIYEALRVEFHRLKEQVPCVTPPSASPSPSNASPLLTPSPSAASLTSMNPVAVVGSYHSSSSTLSQSPPLPAIGSFLSHFCGQLYTYVIARTKAMDFYSKLYTASNGKMIKFRDFSAMLNEIIVHNQKLFHHPLLVPIKSSFSIELEVIHHLLEAQVIMSQWQFLQSLVHLREAQAKLSEWNASIVQSDARRRTTSLLRADKMPSLFTWLNRLYAVMIAKFSLYFNRILSKQTTHQEMKNLGNKLTIDYCQRIAMFHKWTDALCMVLLFDAVGVESYYEHGYRHPDHNVEVPKGIDNYPAIYYYPSTYQEKQHRPNVIMIINNRAAELNNEGIVCFYDTHVDTTYFLTKLDQRVTLIAIYGSQKYERDARIVGFMQDLAQELRGNHVFSALKPGNK
ncbi:KICSTOR subunit 2-like [Ornithodoros turicata]|uniref:KICSTOR subunit 2-like n=1 Tax=Ornithodoros turicata TaxID=34597 RepID=UPI003139E42A